MPTTEGPLDMLKLHRMLFLLACVRTDSVLLKMQDQPLLFLTVCAEIFTITSLSDLYYFDPEGGAFPLDAHD